MALQRRYLCFNTFPSALEDHEHHHSLYVCYLIKPTILRRSHYDKKNLPPVPPLPLVRNQVQAPPRPATPPLPLRQHQATTVMPSHTLLSPDNMSSPSSSIQDRSLFFSSPPYSGYLRWSFPPP